MVNRRRNIQIKFYVNEEENKRILKNMKRVGVENKGEFLRILAQYGQCVRVDTSGMDRLTQEINRIGTNVNQIARKANAGFVDKNDIDRMEGWMREIWQLLRQSLSSLLSAVR